MATPVPGGFSVSPSLSDRKCPSTTGRPMSAFRPQGGGSSRAAEGNGVQRTPTNIPNRRANAPDGGVNSAAAGGEQNAEGPLNPARVGPTTPTRAGRLPDASVDPTEARNATASFGGKGWIRAMAPATSGPAGNRGLDGTGWLKADEVRRVIASRGSGSTSMRPAQKGALVGRPLHGQGAVRSPQSLVRTCRVAPWIPSPIRGGLSFGQRAR